MGKGSLNHTAKKSLGQNFLINPGIAPKMLDESGINGDFGVIEIGPGLGALTKELVKRAKRVVAVELDQDLIPNLIEKFGHIDSFKLVHGDILKIDLESLIAEEFSGMRCAVVGNLPYYITTPILMKLLEERLPIEMIVAMVQKEAAERLAAKEGSRESGAVTLAVRYYSEPEILFDVSPGSFQPMPKVTSSVIKLLVREEPPVSPKDPRFMFSVIKAAFSQRRKVSVNAVSAGLRLEKQVVMEAFSDCGIDLMIRAERMTLADFAAVSDLLSEKRSK